MRQIKVLSISEKRVASYQANWWEHGDVEIIEGCEGLTLSYYRLVATALDREWDENVVMLQDDVWIEQSFPAHHGNLTLYGTRQNSLHVCPHAFSATRSGWLTLFNSLRRWDLFSSVCRIFHPDYEYQGVVTHIEPLRHKELG